MPDNEIISTARSLIAAHGAAALSIAERAGDNVRRLGMTEKARWWAQVVKAVKEIEARGG